MANLVVEIGNTALKAAFTEGLSLGKTFRYQGENAIEYIISIIEKEKPEVLTLASVSKITESDKEKLSQYCTKLIILDPKNHLSEKFGIPSYISSDRAASIVAAREMFKGKPCMLVDFGTIISIDFLNAEGEYIGGNVSPGCRTRFKAINRYSKNLPLLETPDSFPEKGESVESSIYSGVISGIIFEIESYITRNPDDAVVFTGGDAIYFAKRMKNSIFVVCNLVLMGLALISDKYVTTEK